MKNFSISSAFSADAKRLVQAEIAAVIKLALESPILSLKAANSSLKYVHVICLPAGVD